MRTIKTDRGEPAPLGATIKGDIINFAIFSQHAQGAILCLFDRKGKKIKEIKLDKTKNKTGFIWHIAVEGLKPGSILYGYRFKGPYDLKKGHLYEKDKVLTDPYAKELFSPKEWGKIKGDRWLGEILSDTPFDWENISKPQIPVQDLIIYEMHVRGLTCHKSSKANFPGTFKGVIEKIPYLKELGVNAIELLPIYEFNECANERTNPYTKKRLYNYWGYSTFNFFSPMNRFADPKDPSPTRDQFRTMVKELHKNGIEVILDVVYNHTLEHLSDGKETDLCVSYHGIDNSIYYMWSEDGHYMNFSGCGNTFNANAPAPMRLIIDSLHYWASEMGVDGFRFDLASILTRDPQGRPMSDPPLIKYLSGDPMLEGVKLIAEPWDAAGMYQVGHFPSWGKWREWNDQFRDPVRRFIKGTDNQSGSFASALCGSQGIYARYNALPCSVNFVTAHDGFSLYDLVSYQGKHNLANGEDNRDGMNNNESWNCGHEGPTDNPSVLALRDKQMKNFILVLMISQGIPMLLMGDEYGHTRHGNNNTWCQDNELNWFLWDQLEKRKEFFRFCKEIINFRKNHSILKRTYVLGDTEIYWHGKEPYIPNWSHEKRLVAFTLKNPENNEDLYLAFNSRSENLEIFLPDPPQNKDWYRVVATFMPSPDDFVTNPKDLAPLEKAIDMPPYSAIMAKAL